MASASPRRFVICWQSEDHYMAIPITIPRLGWNMEEGVFLGWLKKDGESVKPGDLLFRLESDKATEEIECHDGGILRFAANNPTEGDTVRVGVVIGHLVQAGETEVPSTAYSETVREDVGQAASLSRVFADRLSVPIASPRARRIATELGVDWTKLHG